MGEQPSVKDLAYKSGIEHTADLRELSFTVKSALKENRKIHILPPYRGDHLINLGGLFDIHPVEVKEHISEELIRAVVSLREIKDEYEIQQIEQAVDTCYKMHTRVMETAFPGTWEREIAGQIEGISLSHGNPVSFPVILSMDGQTLHNHYHGNLLKEGRLLVTDAGAESPLHYAGDITRTVPVGGRFTERQKQIYEIVLKANNDSIQSAKSGIRNLDLHLMASKMIASGLKDAGIMKGDIEEAVNLGAHALFFPHGLGHMLGLDVHDMESLGEKFVGYNDSLIRSKQFGLKSLRLGKELKPGFVITIEPGIYFIPALIDIWKKENKFADFINYDEVEKYKDFGGIRIEDDVLITENSSRVLGKPIPKKVMEIEEFMNTD
jgi:Xaa-Pro aminopeptidase